MQADLPHVLYNSSTESSGSEPKKQTVASDEVLRLQEEANRRMQERKAAETEGEKSYDINELFN